MKHCTVCHNRTPQEVEAARRQDEGATGHIGHSDAPTCCCCYEHLRRYAGYDATVAS